jgi:hypothetical protein
MKAVDKEKRKAENKLPVFEVVIGTVVYTAGSYLLDRFLSNIKDMQKSFNSSYFIIATCEPDMAIRIKKELDQRDLAADVITYEVQKPPYARDRIWNIACGREAIRQRFLSSFDAEFLLLLDSDMLFERETISMLLNEINNCDLVFSGYPLKKYGTGLAGCGCVMIRKRLLQEIKFRCYEFPNGQVIFEDNLLEMDSFLAGARIKKGFFVAIEHYFDENNFAGIKPKAVSLSRKLINNPALRYAAVRIAISLKFNFLWDIKKMFYPVK